MEKKYNLLEEQKKKKKKLNYKIIWKNYKKE
jgi:hypothetical protein